MDTTAVEIDGYLSALPADMRAALEALRAVIHAVAPDAVESIAYGMPAFTYRGRPLVYLGAWKRHGALYGTSAGTLRFAPGEPPSRATIEPLIRERMASIEAIAPAPRPSRRHMQA